MMITQMRKKDRVAGLGGKEENLVSYMLYLEILTDTSEDMEWLKLELRESSG